LYSFNELARMQTMTHIAEPLIDVAVDVRGTARAGKVACGRSIDRDVTMDRLDA